MLECGRYRGEQSEQQPKRPVQLFIEQTNSAVARYRQLLSESPVATELDTLTSLLSEWENDPNHFNATVSTQGSSQRGLFEHTNRLRLKAENGDKDHPDILLNFDLGIVYRRTPNTKRLRSVFNHSGNSAEFLRNGKNDLQIILFHISTDLSFGTSFPSVPPILIPQAGINYEWRAGDTGVRAIGTRKIGDSIVKTSLDQTTPLTDFITMVGALRI
jgi:hypothetical protein